MFWRMTGLSTASPVEAILDKEDYTLEELLDEDEIIQECKALNSRLINFLRETTQVEQLLHYIVEEAPEDAEKKRTFKFPFIACEIFTCEVDVILRTLVENEELMTLLFSFLKPERSHSTLLAGYFSKVVICLMLRKAVPLMNFIQGHREIFHQLVDLIGITSVMEVLIRLIGADEHMYSSYIDATSWMEDVNVLEMIVDKFSSSDSPEVHTNAAEILCAITRSAPPGLTIKISSPSFVGRLFSHALEDSRPKSVLVHSLTVCISLLDPKRLVSASYNPFRSQLTHGSSVTANPETVDGMLERLVYLLKLLDNSSPDTILDTTYGTLHPPLGKHRLKIVEFISVLLTVGSETAEKELIRLGAVQRILDLFFEYPFNNFLHHHVENIVISCLESKHASLIEHILHDCNLVDKILGAEKNSSLSVDLYKPTVPAEGRSPPRIGNIGHITRIANKLIQLGNNNSIIQTHLQENNEWVVWHATVLLKRNAVENVLQWTCGRPSALHDRSRDSDDDDRDRDYDVAELANNLSQVVRYYTRDDFAEIQGSLERDDEDVYFDDESAEVVISSLRLGDDQESSSLFTNSDWFAFEDNRVVNERSTGSVASPSPSSGSTDNAGQNDELVDTATSCQVPESGTNSEPESVVLFNGPVEETEEDTKHLSSTSEFEKPPEWVEWRETSDKSDLPDPELISVPNGELEQDTDHLVVEEIATDVGNIKGAGLPGSGDAEAGCSPESTVASPIIDPPEPLEPGDRNSNSEPSNTEAAEIPCSQGSSEAVKLEKDAEETDGN